MAITTLGEAQAINQLAHYLFGTSENGLPTPTSQQARDALALLADAAHRKYRGADLTGDHVRQAWPQIFGRSCDRDPAECSHEAARGHAEAVTSRLRDAIQDVAIRSLQYCENRYGHDDQARLNLQALLNNTTSPDRSRTAKESHP
jgi:hypothetical protein